MSLLFRRIESAFMPLLAGALLLAACGAGSAGTLARQEEGAASRDLAASAHQVPDVGDVIARVGDETVTFSLINTMLNSSAMVGLSVPAPGTAVRSRVVIALLDKVISANLLYLDALRQGADKGAEYRQAISNFSNALLARLYRQQILENDVQVDATEVEAVRAVALATADRALDGDVSMAIEAVLRDKKAGTQKAMLRDRLREGIHITINEKNLDVDDDDVRPEPEIVAMVDAEAITWGEVKVPLLTVTRQAALAHGSLDADAERRKALNKVIDYRIMISKAKVAGLEQDPVYRKRLDEFRKSRLINTWRDQLVAEMEPSAVEIAKFYEEHRGQIAVPESRKVQMVVVESQEAAADIKGRIESGEITIYKAASEYSIDPNAKRTLGDMGWVSKGSGFPELDRLAFTLGPGEVGGPVQSPAGWHVVVVTDVRDARFEDINDVATRAATRRMLLHDRLDRYVVGLRQNEFKVLVYHDKLQQLFRDEGEMMAELENKARQPESLTRQREAEYRMLIQP